MAGQDNILAPDSDDIVAAMRELPGWLDITPGDARELYRLAWRHAVDRLTGKQAVAGLMTRDVAVLAPGQTLAEAARLLAARGITGAPVVAHGQVAGVLSAKDILRALGLAPGATIMDLAAHLLAGAARSIDAQAASLPVESVMSAPALTIQAEASLAEAASFMTAHGVNRLPVTGADGRLVGLVSRSDLVRAFAALGVAP